MLSSRRYPSAIGAQFLLMPRRCSRIKASTSWPTSALAATTPRTQPTTAGEPQTAHGAPQPGAGSGLPQAARTGPQRTRTSSPGVTPLWAGLPPSLICHPPPTIYRRRVEVAVSWSRTDHPDLVIPFWGDIGWRVGALGVAGGVASVMGPGPAGFVPTGEGGCSGRSSWGCLRPAGCLSGVVSLKCQAAGCTGFWRSCLPGDRRGPLPGCAGGARGSSG
jgi:hypothetical protein